MANVDFRLPNITGEDPETQLKQMNSYMYSLVEQLNWAFSTVGEKGGEITYTNTGDGDSIIKAESERTFADDRDLIIKNADEVNASYDGLVKELSGEYVAKSDFGTYLRKTDLKVAATPVNITQFYNDTQEIIGDAQTNTKAYIRTGLIDDTVTPPVYGVQVGQQNDDETYAKFTRFTPRGMEIYPNGNNDPVWAFKDGYLEADRIKADSIDGDKIKAKSLSADQIDVENLEVVNGNFTKAFNMDLEDAASSYRMNCSLNNYGWGDIDISTTEKTHGQHPTAGLNCSSGNATLYSDDDLNNYASVNVTSDGYRIGGQVSIHGNYLDVYSDNVVFWKNPETYDGNDYIHEGNVGSAIRELSVAYADDSDTAQSCSFSRDCLFDLSQDENQNSAYRIYYPDWSVHDVVMRSKKSTDLYVGYSGGITVLRGSSVRLGSTTGNVVTSDKNLKKDIVDIESAYEDFYDNLRPVDYKYILGTSDRNHIGFIAQEVEQSLLDANLTTQNFGGIHITDITNASREKDGDNDEKYSTTNYLKDNGFDKEYGLAYSEFIALNTWQIQKAKKRISDLENTVEFLKEEIANLKNQIAELKK